MRRINKLLLTLYSLICITILSGCSQNQRIINHINTNDLDLALDSTVAFIVERNSSESTPRARINCSGFFISDRLILSALHCFQETISIRLSNGEILQIPTQPEPTGRQFQFLYRNQIEQASLSIINDDINEAIVILIDQETDLALLQLTESSSSSSTHLSISTTDPTIAETIYVIGHPAELAWSTSSGIVSRILLHRNIIQTNISIIGGYSGGPLINMRGEVVGLADAYLRNVPEVSFFTARQAIENFLQRYYSHDPR